MKNFKSVFLLDVILPVRGTEPGSQSYCEPKHGTRFLRVGDISGKVDSPIFTNSERIVLVGKDDVLLVLDGSPGYVAKGFEGAISSGMRKIEIISMDLNPQFLFYVLRSYAVQDVIKQHTRGVTIAHASSALPYIKIPLPPLSEQQRIVDLLDETEYLRATRARANARMEQFIPALFQDMFGDPAKTEFPIKTLNEVANVVSGIAKGRKFNGQKSVTIDYLRVANVQAGYLDLSEIKTIQALPSEVEELQLRIGDVLLTEGGDFDKLGRGAMLDVDLPNCIHQNHVFRARVNQDYLLPVFFHDYLQTQQAKKYFLSCAKKTTNLASINLTQLRALPVPLPHLALQREFAARVGEARGVQSAQVKSAEKIEALYQSMLSQAFGGEL